jgi:hypothetical protein
LRREKSTTRPTTRVARRDFFDVSPDKAFCSLPDGDGTSEIILPPLAAVVGNPPYVRQEKLGRESKLKVEVHAPDCDRMILLVEQPLSALKGTWVARYLRHGETQAFASGKSKPVPVPKRSTCAARDPWYDLTKLLKPGIAFWPMAHHYRHVIPFNPESLICNHRMFDVLVGQSTDPRLLAGILNSTIVALWKTYYGRFTGTEGSLDTEVIDVRALEVPDQRMVSPGHGERIREAFEHLAERPIGRLVEEQLMDYHSPEHARVIASGPLRLADEFRQPDRRALDDAVFELLGAADPAHRRELVDRLYAETARTSAKSGSSRFRSRSSVRKPESAALPWMISPPMFGKRRTCRIGDHWRNRSLRSRSPKKVSQSRLAINRT